MVEMKTPPIVMGALNWLAHDWNQLVQVQNHITFEPNMCSR